MGLALGDNARALSCCIALKRHSLVQLGRAIPHQELLGAVPMEGCLALFKPFSRSAAWYTQAHASLSTFVPLPFVPKRSCLAVGVLHVSTKRNLQDDRPGVMVVEFDDS